MTPGDTNNAFRSRGSTARAGHLPAQVNENPAGQIRLRLFRLTELSFSGQRKAGSRLLLPPFRIFAPPRSSTNCIIIYLATIRACSLPVQNSPPSKPQATLGQPLGSPRTVGSGPLPPLPVPRGRAANYPIPNYDASHSSQVHRLRQPWRTRSSGAHPRSRLTLAWQGLTPRYRRRLRPASPASRRGNGSNH